MSCGIFDGLMAHLLNASSNVLAEFRRWLCANDSLSRTSSLRSDKMPIIISRRATHTLVLGFFLQ